MTLSAYSQILVTGGTGWLGARLVKALTAGLPECGDSGRGGLKVRCLVVPGERTKDLLNLGVEVVTGSVTDKESLTSFTKNSDGALLIHTAGLIHPHLHVKDFDSINTQGTLDLIDAAAKSGIRRCVVMSSNSPFGGNAAPDQMFDENAPYNPYMGYGKSKWRMEIGLKARMGKPGNPEITIARAPWFYGPDQPPRQTLFFRMIRDGKFPILGNGTNRRSMGYIDSLVLGMLLAAEPAKPTNTAFWFADARPYSMLEIVDTVRASLRDDFNIKVKDDTIHLPAVVGDVARLIDGSLQACGLYHQKFHVLSEMNMTIACSIQKAQRELGYQPLVELREGMRRSIASCMAKGEAL